MANKINVKLILELRAAGLSRNQIFSTRHMSCHFVSDVFKIADKLNVTYDSIKELPEEEVYRMFFPDKFAIETLYEQPDYEYVHSELKRVGVTLKILWQEYQDKCKSNGKIPMGYTKFCNGYSDHTIANKLTNHLENKPGVKAEVDWSGPTMSYVDTATGEIVTVYLFVGTLPYSQYSYVEPTLDMKMDSFIRCLIANSIFCLSYSKDALIQHQLSFVLSINRKTGLHVLTKALRPRQSWIDLLIHPSGSKWAT